MFNYRRAAQHAHRVIRSFATTGNSSSSRSSASIYGVSASLACFGLLALNEKGNTFSDAAAESNKYKFDENFNVVPTNGDEEETAPAPTTSPTSSFSSSTYSSSSTTDDDNDPVNWITADEMAKMAAEGRIVVALHKMVYDVTNFTGHPGGVGRLQMAAGGDLAVFYKVYTQHNRGHIDWLLQRYKIGQLSDEDAKIVTANTSFANPYDNDPPTSPHLLTNTRYPYNAEGRLKTLRESWITPIGKHYVRNHCAVPDIDVKDYKLTIAGAGMEEMSFTLEDLKTKFEVIDITTVIQCNGNRREDYHYIDGETPAFGPPHWVAGAISNSTWTGVRLRDLMQAAGMDVNGVSLGKVPSPAREVELLGHDNDEVGNQYCCSFPFEKAIDPFGDVIVAFAMNGEPIPRSHGFPVRAIVPGNAGARSCKFLERVTVTNMPCSEHKNWKQYAVHAPDVHLGELQDFELYKKELVKDPCVQEMPVQSFITHPSAGDILGACNGNFSSVSVKGIAWGGGGSGIARVDVSLDGGQRFTRAELLKNPIEQRRGSQWAWTFFEKSIPIPESIREKLKKGETVPLELTSKALNTSWNVQPENAAPNMNPHGCCVNHWYRVPISLDPKVNCEVVEAEEGEFGNKPSGGKFRRPFRNLDEPPKERVKCYRTNKCISQGCEIKCVGANDSSSSSSGGGGGGKGGGGGGGEVRESGDKKKCGSCQCGSCECKCGKKKQ